MQDNLDSFEIINATYSTDSNAISRVGPYSFDSEQESYVKQRDTISINYDQTNGWSWSNDPSYLQNNGPHKDTINDTHHREIKTAEEFAFYRGYETLNYKFDVDSFTLEDDDNNNYISSSRKGTYTLHKISYNYKAYINNSGYIIFYGGSRGWQWTPSLNSVGINGPHPRKIVSGEHSVEIESAIDYIRYIGGIVNSNNKTKDKHIGNKISDINTYKFSVDPSEQITFNRNGKSLALFDYKHFYGCTFDFKDSSKGIFSTSDTYRYLNNLVFEDCIINCYGNSDALNLINSKNYNKILCGVSKSTNNVKIRNCDLFYCKFINIEGHSDILTDNYYDGSKFIGSELSVSGSEENVKFINQKPNLVIQIPIKYSLFNPLYNFASDLITKDEIYYSDFIINGSSSRTTFEKSDIKYNASTTCWYIEKKINLGDKPDFKTSDETNGEWGIKKSDNTVVATINKGLIWVDERDEDSSGGYTFELTNDDSDLGITNEIIELGDASEKISWEFRNENLAIEWQTLSETPITSFSSKSDFLQNAQSTNLTFSSSATLETDEYDFLNKNKSNIICNYKTWVEFGGEIILQTENNVSSSNFSKFFTLSETQISLTVNSVKILSSDFQEWYLFKGSGTFNFKFEFTATFGGTSEGTRSINNDKKLLFSRKFTILDGNNNNDLYLLLSGVFSTLTVAGFALAYFQKKKNRKITNNNR
jgi:hypothetical protein